MIGSTDFIDEIDCDSFFDDLIDFPNAYFEASDTTAIDAAVFPSIWTTHPESSLPCPDSAFFRKTASESDLSTELFVPYEDIVQLEWMSKFAEGSECGASLTIKKEDSSSINKASHHQLPRQLEKKDKKIKLLEKKDKKIKLSLSAPAATAGADHNSQNSTGQPVRKCMHCEITKTPQWRAGPMGPKTLCNACGVRHKSGRLFPEYRPAASPTFVPSLHSNSHKKVAEMRGKSCTTTMVANSLPELIPDKSNSALGYI